MIFETHRNRLLVVICGALIALLMFGTALATDFEFVMEIAVNPTPPFSGIGGIARVGEQWFTANYIDGWYVYDLDFNLVGTTTVTPDLSWPYGLVYDSNAGSVFITDGNTIYECTTDGEPVDSFPSTGQALVALAFNPDNDHLFAVHYAGYVAELTRNGVLVGSFTLSGDWWTGAAYDAVNGTLLVMTGDDQVQEYATDGTLLGTPLSGDCVYDNGLGLHYDADTGFLHATGQFGDIGIWQREVIVATENASWGSVKALYR